MVLRQESDDVCRGGRDEEFKRNRIQKNAAAVAHEHYRLKFDDVWQRYTTENGKAVEKPTTFSYGPPWRCSFS